VVGFRLEGNLVVFVFVPIAEHVANIIKVDKTAEYAMLLSNLITRKFSHVNNFYIDRILKFI